MASESGLNNGINSQELFLSPVSETNQAGETSTESFFHFKQDNILFVTSHNISFLWHNSFFQSFSDHLMKSSQRAINIDLIVVKNRDDNILVPSARYVDLIEAQLEEYDYDMIIADGNEVANLFFNNILIVPKECIFVFCNYIGEGYKEAKISNMTGFVLPETEIENLKLGAKLFPNAKKGVLIVDGTEAGEVLCETALKRRDEIPLEEVEIISGSDYSTQGMLTKLKTLDPEKDFVVFYSWRSQHSPKIYNSQEVVDIMKNTFHGPILNGWDAYTKLGFLGGEVIKTEDASLALVSIVNQIFRGVKPEIIPIETCKTHLIFNYDGLQKFNLRPSMILDQFELINQPKPFVERNMTFILSLFSLLLLSLIVALIYQYFKLVQMNRPISLLRLLPIGLVVTDFDGKILFLSSGLLFKNRIAKGSYIQDIALYNGELCQKILDTLRENKNLESNSGNFKYNGHQWVLTAQRIDYNVFGKEVLFWVSSDVEDMYRMLRVEQGIGDILSDLILQRSFDIIISRSFDLMVNYIDADRMGFFEFNSTTNSFTRKKSWIRNEKIPPPDEKIINTLYKQYGEEIRNNGLYLSSKVVDPEKYKVVEDDLKGRSILIVPCFIAQSRVEYSYLELYEKNLDTEEDILASELGNQLILSVPITVSKKNATQQDFIKAVRSVNTERVTGMLGVFTAIDIDSDILSALLNVADNGNVTDMKELLNYLEDSDYHPILEDYGIDAEHIPLMTDLCHAFIDFGNNVDFDILGSFFRKVDNEWYTLYTVSFSGNTEDAEAQAAYKEIIDLCSAYFGSNRYYPVGMITSSYEMGSITPHDFMVVTLVSVAIIYFIVTLLLRNPLKSLIIIVIIELGIWINLSFNFLFGQSINFIVYVIISSVQLGCTVDYAILFANTFEKNRSKYATGKECAIETATEVIPPILTSALMIGSVCLGMYLISSNLVIKQLTGMLARGALINFILVIFVQTAVWSLFKTARRDGRYEEKLLALENAEKTEISVASDTNQDTSSLENPVPANPGKNSRKTKKKLSAAEKLALLEQNENKDN